MKPLNAQRLRAELCKINEVKGACAIHHRHLKKVLGGLVGVRVVDESGVAVAWGMISRPVSRHLQARNWVEFTRGIVPDGAPPNCASLLLAFAAQWARKQRLPGDGKKPSGRPICTYTLGHEPGTSLVAAGWVQVGNTAARATWQSSDRTRETRTGVLAEPKRRWVASYCVDVALSEGFPLSPEPRSDVMYPETIDLHTAPGRAVHLQRNARVECFYEVVDVGVGTARFADAADAAAFFSYLKGDLPVSKPKPDAPLFPLIAAIPGVHLYYDYGRWHISLRSRQDEDRLVYASPAPGVVPDGVIYTPITACFSVTEARRRGLETWSKGVWAAGARFIFPAIPAPGRGADNLNNWGSTDFTPYAEVTLAHNLGLVEAIDAEAAPAPGVRSVLLRGGTTLFVRRSTPLGLARGADGSWRVWLGDGEGWRAASGPSDALWSAVQPVCFGTPVNELTEFLPGATSGVAWEMIASSGDVIPAAADAVGDILMMANIAGDILCFVDDDIPDEDDREAFDAWTIFTAA